MDNAQKKFVIITASILLHAVTLFVILVLYHQPTHDLFAVDSSQAIDITETIFYDPASNNSASEPPEPTSVFDNWAQLNPCASTLGDSMEMPDGPIGPEIPGDASDSQDEGDIDAESSENFEHAVHENSLEFDPEIKIFEDFSEAARPELVEGSERPEDRSNGSTRSPRADIKSEIKTSSSTSKTSTKKRARNALASITRGYLQQLKDEGENLIKTLGGDPNKKPTAEQLKYERYLAKIQWCLQNAHSINQEKCQLQEPIEAVMRIYFVLNREGKMTGFKIMQSSGKAYVDQYISSLFQFAASSFPPLPAYVKEDYLPLTYSVMVNWNTSSPMGFSRY